MKSEKPKGAKVPCSALLGWTALRDSLPPRGQPVMTKIDDATGCRNEQVLKLGTSNNLWWFADGSMYVYYSPTHWKPNAD